MRRSRHLTSTILVPLIAVSAGLAIGELLLRNVFHVAPQVDLNIYRRDSHGNLRIQPNLDKRHVTPLWDVAVRTDSGGWRDEPGESLEVLGLGDSFAFGWGVEEGEGLYRLLEQEWGRDILNAAVPGTSAPDQAQLLASEFTDANPETVLLAFFVGNDFTEARIGGAKLFAVEGGRLRYVRSHPGWPAKALDELRSFRVLQLLRALQFRYGFLTNDGPARNWDEWLRMFAKIHLREGESSQLFGPAAGALETIAQWSRRRGADFHVIVIPRSWQIDEQELAGMLDALQIDATRLDLDRPQDFLAEWGAEQGVSVIDLLPAFRQAVADDPSLRLHHTPDAHWTPVGHALAARTVAKALRGIP